MAQFAELIGCKQSTISRYESGRLPPSRSVLMLLLQHAGGAERKVLLDHLGVERRVSEGWSEQQLIDSLRTFEGYLNRLPEAADTSKARQVVSPLVEFALVAKQKVLGEPAPDPALNGIIKCWLAHRNNPKAAEYLRRALAYLTVELAVPDERPFGNWASSRQG